MTEVGSTGTLLLTGAQGFLGRHIASAWLGRDSAARVVGVGRSAFQPASFTYGHSVTGAPRAALPESLLTLTRHQGWSYRRVDLADAASVRALVLDVRPGVVVHSAAALRGESLPALISANVLATATLARAVGELAAGTRFVHVSSGSVHGLSADAGSGPGAGGAPSSDPEPYAATKRAAELMLAAECAASGLSAVSGRVFNLIGPGLQDRHLPGRVALELAAMESRGGGELRVGSLEAVRDLVYVRDAADALVALASASAAAFDRLPVEGPLRVVDVGTGRPVRMRDLVRLQIEAMGLVGRVDVIESEVRRLGAAALRADASAIAALGASARIPLQRSIADMADYARSQR